METITQHNNKRSMEQHFDWDKLTAIVCAMIGGMYSFLTNNLTFLDIGFDSFYWISLGKAAITAVVCGFAGLGGKWIFGQMVKAWKSRKKSIK